jgi:hypothetical protein
MDPAGCKQKQHRCFNFDELVKNPKFGFSVIPAKFSMPRLGAWHPRMDENPPSPPFSKGGLGGILKVIF